LRALPRENECIRHTDDPLEKIGPRRRALNGGES
jgi:hypothetical protein